MPNYNTCHIEFPRSAGICNSRQALPVAKEEFEIMEAVIENDIVLITGATGSGKTTQVPQFLLEAGFGNEQSQNPGKVLVTQPRRLAVVSSAERIREELGAQHYVSFRTRHESSVHEASLLDVVTDGVLIREMLEHPLLEQYSVIVLDEVHERSYNCDLLIALLCRIVKVRNNSDYSRSPLRLVLMSATIQDDISTFVHTFGTVKRIDVQGQIYPVSVHFSRKNPDDYVESVAKKIRKIITNLPAGKILAFLPSKADIRSCAENLSGIHGINVICVHGSISKEQQSQIFTSTRSGTDIFLATNVAETSITIPEVTYIVDSGKVKRKIFDDDSGTFKFEVGWISKASSQQRMGRTGRTNSGHCYRLYTADTFYESFTEHDEPEICKMRLDSHVLLCLRLGINNPELLLMPTMPLFERFESAISRLKSLQVIDLDKKIRDEYLLVCDLPMMPECAVLLVRAILEEFEIKRLSLAVLVCLTMCFDEICYDPKSFACHYKSFFKSDVIFDAYLVSGYKNGLFKDNINEKAMAEVSKLYDNIAKTMIDLLDIKLIPVEKIRFEKRICDSIRTLFAYSPKFLTAVRSDPVSDDGKGNYLCCDNQSCGRISKRSFLHSNMPRIISFRGRIIGAGGKCILTRITDISK